MFGLPKTGGQVASDHWGLGVTLQFGDIPADLRPRTLGVLSTVAAQTITLPRLPVNFNDGQLRETCVEDGFIPSDAQNRTFHNTLGTLRDLVASLSPTISSPPISSSEDASVQVPPVTAVRLVVAPVGSFAMGYHTANRDLDCVILVTSLPKRSGASFASRSVPLPPLSASSHPPPHSRRAPLAPLGTGTLLPSPVVPKPPRLPPSAPAPSSRLASCPQPSCLLPSVPPPSSSFASCPLAPLGAGTLLPTRVVPPAIVFPRVGAGTLLPTRIMPPALALAPLSYFPALVNSTRRRRP